MKRRTELGMMILLPLLILGILVLNARVMSTYYMTLEGLDQTTKIYGEQFSVSKQTIAGVPGQTLSVNVTVRNTGNFIWPQGGSNPVHLSYHILDANKKAVRQDGLRVDLPNDLRPGQQVTVPLKVIEPGQAGNYFIQLDMVQEGMTWFGAKGGETCLLSIRSS